MAGEDELKEKEDEEEEDSGGEEKDEGEQDDLKGKEKHAEGWVTVSFSEEMYNVSRYNGTDPAYQHVHP